jgi:mannose-6-phosphate isomerase-like protein (cupin superfamily)
MAQVGVRERVKNLPDLIKNGEYTALGDPDLAGYTICRIVEDERTRHLINIIKVEPGKGKYSHWHDGGETVWVVLQGTGLFRLDEKTEIPVGPGDFFHSFPTEVHGSDNPSSEDIYYLCVEGPRGDPMQKDLNARPKTGYRQGRVLNLNWEIEKGGFAPVHEVIPGASAAAATDLPGYTVKLLVPMSDPRTRHLIEIVNIEPGFKKFTHSHDNAETVIYFLEGEGEFFLDDNTTVPVKAGDCAHAFPGELHGARNLGSTPLRYLVVEGPLPLNFRRPE